MRTTLAIPLLLLLGCPKDPVDDTSPPDTTPQVTDADEDGFPEDEDCNDRDAAVNPDATEVCDGVDNDCDGETDEGLLSTFFPDADEDGYGDGGAGEEHCEAPSGFVSDDTDCDDSRDDVHPGAEEHCDGADNDCDDEIDEDGDSTWYQDADGDGQGDAAVSQVACSPGEGWASNADDCDDSRDDVYTGAEELCDALDNDCDGAVDEGVTTTYYADLDEDGYGDPDNTVEACEQPEGYLEDQRDCDDADATVNPAGSEVCNEVDDDCDGTVDEGVTTTFYADADGDGYGDGASAIEACELPDGYADNTDDCDDTNGALNPAAAEYCDGYDNDCDGTVDNDDALDASTWYEDRDRDGYGDSGASSTACTQPSGSAAKDGDCDDRDPDVFPGADELCNTTDDDCDGAVDEAPVDGTSWYLDDDGDGYGAAGTSDVQVACDQPPGYAPSTDDCADDDFTINPGADEDCDGLDNDCDGLVDADDPGVTDAATWYTDGDGDGWGDPTTGVVACSQPGGTAAHGYAGDCDDGDATVHPNADELCDGVDNDCDGLLDDADADVLGTSTWYPDADVDGYGDAAGAIEACSQPAGTIATGGDCDDGDPGILPGAEEHCDGVDEDCDGEVDEEPVDGLDFYADADGDGYGDAGVVSWACTAPTGTVADATDCDDGDAAVNPDADEPCSGEDMNCDGVAPAVCATCAEHIAADPGALDGLYDIDPAGTGVSLQAWCDMSTDGGGWTLVQRTVWDWAVSELLWTGYSDWYGSTIGVAQEGEAYRLAGELWSFLNFDREILAVHQARDAADSSSCDPLYYTGESATLSVSASEAWLTGLVSDVDLVSSTELSTRDSGGYSSCVTAGYGVPWFYGGCCITCPTYKGAAWSDEPHPMAKYLDTDVDLYGLTDLDACPSGASEKNASGAGVYEGVNVMEFYLR